jgi:hypothetical protein
MSYCQEIIPLLIIHTFYNIPAAEILYANLQEHVEAADMGLPKDCDPNSINWINRVR